MNTIKVAGTGPIEQRVEALEQAVNYGEVVLPFTVMNDQDVITGGTAAGGDLSGTYPNPRVRRSNWATTAGLPALAAAEVTRPSPETVLLHSPNGQAWIISVSDDGILQTTRA